MRLRQETEMPTRNRSRSQPTPHTALPPPTAAAHRPPHAPHRRPGAEAGRGGGGEGRGAGRAGRQRMRPKKRSSPGDKTSTGLVKPSPARRCEVPSAPLRCCPAPPGPLRLQPAADAPQCAGMPAAPRSGLPHVRRTPAAAYFRGGPGRPPVREKPAAGGPFRTPTPCASSPA